MGNIPGIPDTPSPTGLPRDLALLPYPPEAPVRESLDFLTDVMISHNGTEDRIQLRSKPRQSFTYKIPTQAWNMANAFNVGYAAIRDRWAVPVWPEGQYIGLIHPNTAFISCATSSYDLRPNSYALIYAACESYQLVEITTVEPNGINIIGDVGGFKGAWLIPVRLGWIAGNMSRQTNGHNAITEITFEIEDNPTYDDITPEQYSGNDIYYEPGLLSSGSITRTVEKISDVADFDLGPVARRSPWLNARYGTPYRSVLVGPEEIRAYKDWLFRRAGKFRAFWMPTFEANLRVVGSGNIATTLMIEADSFIPYGSKRTHIAIQGIDGQWRVRTILYFLQMGADRVQLTLSSPLNMASSSIAHISYLGLNRLDTDKIELQWIGGGVVESNVRILEITP